MYLQRKWCKYPFTVMNQHWMQVIWLKFPFWKRVSGVKQLHVCHLVFIVWQHSEDPTQNGLPCSSNGYKNTMIKGQCLAERNQILRSGFKQSYWSEAWMHLSRWEFSIQGLRWCQCFCACWCVLFRSICWLFPPTFLCILEQSQSVWNEFLLGETLTEVFQEPFNVLQTQMGVLFLRKGPKWINRQILTKSSVDIRSTDYVVFIINFLLFFHSSSW